MNTEALAYREATSADISQLKQLGIASYGQYNPLLTPENAEKLMNNMSKDETWADVLAIAKSYVCVAGNEIVGMAFLVPHGHPNELFTAEWAYIRLVGVDPKYQGMGIAKELTKLCIGHAKATGEKIIALHTSEVMHAARHIYASLGFTISHEVEKRLGLRYWVYLLNL